jgi:hypothetical protein
LQTALLPETYRAGHDMSRTGEPYLKTGEQARSDTPRGMMTRQQNRRVLLPFGPTLERRNDLSFDSNLTD